MYDELIKRLRNCATQAAPCNTCDLAEDSSCSDTLMKRAADAIEELQKREPKWIPVTERLPCLTTPVLVTDGIEVDIAWMYGVPPRWITSYTAIDEDKLTHWMPLPQTPKEEDA